MNVLLWHCWVLEGAGSNVYTANVAEVLRAAGHDVVLLCQEPHPERYPWIDAWATLDGDGPSTLTPSGVDPATGRCVLLRPSIGDLLPVFVIACLLLVATLIHLERFHHDLFGRFWLVAYVAVPPVLLFCLWRQLSQPGADADRGAPSVRAMARPL